MTTDLLATLMQKRRTILTDGATATDIMSVAEKRRIELPAALEMLNFDKADLVREHHRAYIDAGSEIVLTNSWAANQYALQDFGVNLSRDEIRELNRVAARILREAADGSDSVVCAGSVGPTEWVVLDPADRALNLHRHEIRFDEAVAAYVDQVSGLVAGGVDVVWIETQVSKHEADAAVEACRQVAQQMGQKISFAVTMVFNRNERTHHGYDVEHFADDFGRHCPELTTFGFNCGHGPEVALEIIARHPAFWRNTAPMTVKANCGSPFHIEGRFEAIGLTPAQMGRYAQLACDYGVKIVGACCGSSPTHIRAMRDALDGYTPGKLLSPDRIHAEIMGTQ
jgi:methionine synthase I (cobalamin-dependent)